MFGTTTKKNSLQGKVMSTIFRVKQIIACSEKKTTTSSCSQKIFKISSQSTSFLLVMYEKLSNFDFWATTFPYFWKTRIYVKKMNYRVNKSAIIKWHISKVQHIFKYLNYKQFYRLIDMFYLHCMRFYYVIPSLPVRHQHQPCGASLRKYW